MTPRILDAIENGHAVVRRKGMSFAITFEEWFDGCECPTCEEQRALFDYLAGVSQPGSDGGLDGTSDGLAI
jgi:hypothetical protein